MIKNNCFLPTLLTIFKIVSIKCCKTLLIICRCNGTSECLRGEDENGCGCTKDQFKCANSERCIPKQWTCDKENNCGDNSDEDPYMCQHIPTGSHVTGKSL